MPDEENAANEKKVFKIAGLNSGKPKKKFAPKAQSNTIPKPVEIKPEPSHSTKSKSKTFVPKKNFDPKHKKNLIQSSSVFDQGIGSDTNFGPKNARYNDRDDRMGSASLDSMKIAIDKDNLGEKMTDLPYEEFPDVEVNPLEIPNDFPFSTKSQMMSQIDNNCQFSLATYYFPDELNCLSLEAGKDDSILNSHISGQIGKLRTYKSGKRDIIIGNSVYDYQEVQNLCIEKCYMREDIMDTAAKFVDIGTSSTNVVVSPNISHLLKEASIS